KGRKGPAGTAKLCFLRSEEASWGGRATSQCLRGGRPQGATARVAPARSRVAPLLRRGRGRLLENGGPAGDLRLHQLLEFCRRTFRLGRDRAAELGDAVAHGRIVERLVERGRELGD